jgi:hypothetical protein
MKNVAELQQVASQIANGKISGIFTGKWVEKAAGEELAPDITSTQHFQYFLRFYTRSGVFYDAVVEVEIVANHPDHLGSRL